MTTSGNLFSLKSFFLALLTLGVTGAGTLIGIDNAAADKRYGNRYNDGVYFSGGSYTNSGLHHKRRHRVENTQRRSRSRVIIHNQVEGDGYVTGVERYNRNNSRHHNANRGYGHYKNHHHSDFDYGIAVIAPPRPPSPCPTGFDCGYRLYENGTGPRIIVPGLDRKGLPEQDGIRGPHIIRVQ